MSLGGLSGLASGVDTSGIVDQLMAIERQATTRLALRQSAVTARRRRRQRRIPWLRAFLGSSVRRVPGRRGATHAGERMPT